MSTLFDSTLEQFKRKLARQLMSGFTLVICVGLPLSLFRWSEIGFQPIFVLHIIVSIATLCCYFRPNKTNYHIDFVVLIVILSSMIVGGMFSYGLQSGVITFATFTSFLFAILWGVRSAVWFSVAWFGFVLLLGYLFVNDIVDYTVPPEVYSATYGSWVIVAVGSCLSITLLLIGAHQGYSALVSQLKKIEAQQAEIEYLANHDTLTDYYAPRLAIPMIEAAINQAKRNNAKVAVVFVDLNDFKQVNDNYGHDIGDKVIAKSATLLKAEIRDVDSAIRVGGDEFLYILSNIHNTDEAIEIVERQINRLNSFTSINKHPINISASAGLAIYPDHSEDPKQLRSYADKAMYDLKQHKQESIKLFSQAD